MGEGGEGGAAGGGGKGDSKIVNNGSWAGEGGPWRVFLPQSSHFWGIGDRAKKNSTLARGAKERLERQTGKAPNDRRVKDRSEGRGGEGGDEKAPYEDHRGKV